MKRFLIAIAVLALLGLTASSMAGQQNRPRGPGGEMAMAMNPIAFLLTQTDSLELTEELTTRFTALGDSLDVELEPHREAMRSARGSGGGMQAMRSRMQEMRGTRDAWLEKAMALLEPTQREVAQRLLDRHRPRGPGGGR